MSTTSQTTPLKLIRPTLPTVGATLADLRTYCGRMLDFGLAVYANPDACPTPFDTEDRRFKFRASLGQLDSIIISRCAADPALDAAYDALFPLPENVTDFFNKMGPITINGAPATDETASDDRTPAETETDFLNQFLLAAICEAFTEIADLLYARFDCKQLVDLVLNDTDDHRPLDAFLDDIAFAGPYTVLQGGKPGSPRYVAVLNNPTWRALLSCADASIPVTGDHHHKYLESVDISEIEPLTGNRRMSFNFGR